MQQSTFFVVVHAEIHYRLPGWYGETLTVEVTVPDVTPTSFTFAHVLREKVSGRVVVKSSARLAAMDVNGKVKRMDKTLVGAMQFPPQSS